MGGAELLLTALALSMDALAVSVTIGLTLKKITWRPAVKTGVFFGVFQALMPTLGYVLGTSVRGLIVSVDHWIAFALLGAIGGKMIVDGYRCQSGGECKVQDPTNTKTLLMMAVATSIDALAIGISMAMTQVNIGGAALCIGLVTFALSALGVLLGKSIGNAFEKYAQIGGGVVLCAIGIRILIEHMSMGI